MTILNGRLAFKPTRRKIQGAYIRAVRIRMELLEYSEFNLQPRTHVSRARSYPPLVKPRNANGSPVEVKAWLTFSFRQQSHY